MSLAQLTDRDRDRQTEKQTDRDRQAVLMPVIASMCFVIYV